MSDALAQSAPSTRQDAYRFLAQATFGARPNDVDHLLQIGYDGWVTEQIGLPISFSYTSRAAREPCYPNLACIGALGDVFWTGTVIDPAQLRQRMTFALSQIFVISTADGSTYYWGNGAAAFANNLYRGAFGNFRDLLEAVSRNTATGNFLSFIYNEKENPATGTIPDQNYAREVMQLFTIGLVQLNLDGTPKLDKNGTTIPTYTQDDVVGASRVMTGFAPAGATSSDFNNHYCFCQNRTAAQFQPMVGLSQHHSTSEKKFLGVTIAASQAANPDADLKIFLDTLFRHPNVGPFIGRQLIQRLVTSNPSRHYIARVASVFNNNGHGVRGDMGAVVRAILLDPEARSTVAMRYPNFGKIREPVLRMAHIMRVFNATADTDGSFHISPFTYDVRKGLWQVPFSAKTVFNFYYPSYTPPLSTLAARNLVAPEMQITTTISIADQDHFLDDVFQNGGITDCCSDALRNKFWMRLHYDSWLPLVAQPDTLIEQLNQQFLSGQMSDSLRSDLRAAMAASYNDHSSTSGELRGVDQIKFSEALRTLIASPDYVVQK